jgi:hypothetical protein
MGRGGGERLLIMGLKHDNSPLQEQYNLQTVKLQESSTRGILAAARLAAVELDIGD